MIEGWEDGDIGFIAIRVAGGLAGRFWCSGGVLRQ